MAVNSRLFRRKAWFWFVLYLLVLLYFLFFSERFGRVPGSEYHYNLQLFHEIRRYLNNEETIGWQNVLINIGGNILAFMPFGFIWPRLHRRRTGVLRTTFTCFEFSLLVELVQLITRLGAFDVDDLLLNTIGGFLGAALGVIIFKQRKS